MAKQFYFNRILQSLSIPKFAMIFNDINTENVDILVYDALGMYLKKKCILSYSVDFNAPREFWNLLSKAVPGEFDSSGI